MQEELNLDSFKCNWCSKIFPTCYDLYVHLHAHQFCDNIGVPPSPPPPQLFNRLPFVERDEVNQPSLTLSIGRSKVNDHDTAGLAMEETIWRQYRTSRYHPYLKPTNKGKEPLVETVDDNFVTMDLLREWEPIRGFEWHGYDSWSSSSSPISNASTSHEIGLMNLNGGEKLDLNLKLGF